jgi:hypothetical protein
VGVQKMEAPCVGFSVFLVLWNLGFWLILISENLIHTSYGYCYCNLLELANLLST